MLRGMSSGAMSSRPKPFRKRLRLLALALWIATCASPLAARAADLPPFGRSEGAAIESCVSHEAIRFRSGEQRALLDEPDRRQVHAAMLVRYPILQRDGFEPSYIVLWQKQGSDWLYVTLLANGDKPSEVCFTATFAAGAFEFTGPLLKKYFFLRPERT
jgi:hypothetical protein